MNKILTSKKFILFTLILLIVYILYHIIIWYTYSSKIFDREDNLYIGDLGRMSYQIDSLYPRKLQYTLPHRILNAKRYDQNVSIDVLTVGDSFSNGGGAGKNPYYQDYLATKYNLNILNIVNFAQKQHKVFDAIIALYNNGWLKKHKPKLVIIESAQRGVYQRFSKDFNFLQKKILIKNLIEPARTTDPYLPKLKLINTANYKIPFYTFKYKFNIRAQKDVVKLHLSKKLFSPKNYKNSILFHYSDVLNINNDQNLVNKINENFNHLAKLLQTLNIKLLFLVAPDKYNIYYKYLEKNPFQENKFFELIKPLKKEYLFIDAQTILRNKLQQGTLDLYYSDDTHWSYKASDAVTDDSIFQQFKQ